MRVLLRTVAPIAVGPRARHGKPMNDGDRWEHPRTLIVGRGFDQTSGAGITLSSLFRDWPRDRLAAACAASETMDTSVCENYYALGSEEARWIWPLSRFGRSIPSGPVPLHAGDGDERLLDTRSTRLARPNGGAPMSRARRAFWGSVVASGAEHFLLRRHVSARLAAWIRAFRPEVIYTHLESLPMIGFVDSIVTQFDLPLVIHMMDDWPSVPEHEGFLSPVTKRVIDRKLRRLMDKASCNMGISRYMCDAFQAKYAHEFLPFHNVLDTRTWTVTPRTNWAAAEPFLLVYAGRVGKANEVALRDVAAVVAMLAEKGLPLRLEVYALDRAPFPAGTWPASRAVRVLPAVSYAEIPELLVRADLLVLPLDFALKDLAYARYSMPTKVAEYLGAGTPILVYCPEDSAVTQYARSAGWGAIVGTRDFTALSRTIARLVADETERERLGRVALSVAQTDHDPSRVRADFARALFDASTANWIRRRKEGWSSGRRAPGPERESE